MDSIIDALRNNPIFKMSLGSKELFHSNFLEYLHSVNPTAFLEMINSLLLTKNNQLKPLDYDYKPGREMQNFDFCLYHTVKTRKSKNHPDGGEKVVFDLVIENKVKSIAYKEQLVEYADKARKSNKDCLFILLTLTEDFPDKDSEDINDWSVVGYKRLMRNIEHFYIYRGLCQDEDFHYIKDYCAFIEKLCELNEKVILPKTLNRDPLFDSRICKALKSIRLHDLYIKLRCSWFALKLKCELEKTVPVKVVHKYGDIEKNNKYVNINVDLNQGNGQIAAWIWNGDTDDKTMKQEQLRKLNNTFEIVIQGNQYRHGINHSRIRLSEKGIDDKYQRLKELYGRLKNYEAAYDFLNFGGIDNVQPDSKDVKFRGSSVEKEGTFNCYSDSYIYRYIEITEKEPIEELRKNMITDIRQVLENPPKLV